MEKQSVEQPIIITDRSQIEGAVGKLVILRGVVKNTQMPTLLGVDIESDDPDLRGQPATATGILKKEMVTQAEIDREIKESGQFPNRGPGTSYRLVDPVTGKVAQVQKP